MPAKKLIEKLVESQEPVELKAAVFGAFTSLEDRAAKIRDLALELQRRVQEVPSERLKAYNQVARRCDELANDSSGKRDEFFGYAEHLLNKVNSGGEIGDDEAKHFAELRKACEQEIDNFFVLYRQKGIDGFISVGGSVPEEKLEVTEAPEAEALPKKEASEESKKYDLLLSKVQEWADDLDNLSIQVAQLRDKLKTATLPQELADNISWCDKALKYSIQTRSELSDLIYAARAGGVEELPVLSDKIAKYEKHIEMLRGYVEKVYAKISTTEERVAAEKKAEDEKRRLLDERLQAAEDLLNKFIPADPDTRKFRDDILKQIPELKTKKLEEVAIANLEALIKNRIIAPEKNQRAKEAKTAIKEGLKQYGPKLEKLMGAFSEIAPVKPEKKTSIELAFDLYRELELDWKDIGADNAEEQMAKFEKFKDHFSSAEKQFKGPIEAEIVRKRVKKLSAILKEADANPDLPKIHRQRVKNLLEDIGTIKSVDQLARVEDMVREYIQTPLSKKAIIREMTDKAEKKFEEEGYKMGMIKPGEVEKKIKYGIKEILSAGGVVDINPKEFIDKLRPEQMGELAVCVLEKNNVEMEKLLRDFVREVAPQVASEHREAIAREIRSTLTAAIESEIQAEVSKQENKEISKVAKAGQIGLKIAGNVGVALGIGVGVASVVSSAGLAAVISGGAIAGSRLLNKYLGKKISESEKYKKAKEKVTGVWGKVGRLFKKEELPVDAEQVREQVILKFITQEKLSVLVSNQIRESTSALMTEKIKQYSAHRDAAMAAPSAENVAKFSEALDDASYNFYLNALNYVEAEHAGENLSEEEKAKIAVMLAHTLGVKERGEIAEAQEMRELREKAKTPEEKHILVQKFEWLQKLKMEGVSSVGFGMATSLAIRQTTAAGRIFFGALGGAAAGLAIERATKSESADKEKKIIEKMISDTEKKITGKEAVKLSEKQLKKAVDDCAHIQSRIDLGILDDNPMLKSRAQNFIFRVRTLQFEAIEAKTPSVDKIIDAVHGNTDRYEKENKKALDKLRFLSPKKRQLLFMAGGALAGAALGAAGAFISDYLKAPKPEEITPHELPPEEIKPRGPSIVPMEKTPEPTDEMVFTEEEASKLQAAEAAKHARHFEPRGLAHLRAHEIPDSFAGIKKSVGVETAEWVSFLDKNNYHKLSQDLYNAKLNMTEYAAQAAGETAKIEKVADMTEQFERAEQLLKNHKYAEAGKVLRDISRSALHERPRFMEAAEPKVKLDTYEDVYKKPSTPLTREIDTEEEVFGPEKTAPGLYTEEEVFGQKNQEPEIRPEARAGETAESLAAQAEVVRDLREAGNNILADKVQYLGRDVGKFEVLIDKYIEEGKISESFGHRVDVLVDDYNRAIELFRQGRNAEAGELLEDVNDRYFDLNNEASDLYREYLAGKEEAAGAAAVATGVGTHPDVTAAPVVEPVKAEPAPEASETSRTTALEEDEDEEDVEAENDAEREEPKPEETAPEKPKAEEEPKPAESQPTPEEEAERAAKEMEQLLKLPKKQQEAYFWLHKEVGEHPDNGKLQDLHKKFVDEMMKGKKGKLGPVVTQIDKMRK